MANIAIVGAGTMGTIHAESCANLPDAAATWIVDTDRPRADALAATTGARPTADFAEALADPALDAVVVAVPTPFHREITERAAEAGKHVLYEKPVALSLADARAMTNACRRAGVRFMVGHIVRFFPEYARIGALLAEGAVGQVGVVRASRLNAYPHVGRSWYANFAWSGGPILDLMIHDLDTLRWYFGEVERVYARGLSYGPHAATVDHALAIIRFASGVIAHVETSWAYASFRTAIEIAGSGGLLRHASDETVALRLESAASAPAEGVQVPRSPLAETPYQTELRHFLDRIVDDGPILTDGDEATRTLAATLAVLESVRTGRPVAFADGWPQLAADGVVSR